MLNTAIFETIKKHQKKILVVTKYWDTEKTSTILDQVLHQYETEVF